MGGRSSWEEQGQENTMIQFVLLFSRQGKLRLQKWFDAYQVRLMVQLGKALTADLAAYAATRYRQCQYTSIVHLCQGNICLTMLCC